MGSSSNDPFEQYFDQYYEQYFDQTLENLSINYGGQEEEKKKKKKRIYIERSSDMLLLNYDDAWSSDAFLKLFSFFT